MIRSEEEVAAPDSAAAVGPDAAVDIDVTAMDVGAMDIEHRLARLSGIELPGIDDLAFLRVAERVFPSFPRSDRYEGVELLDTGATSSVWRAFDKQLQLDVAIKVFDRSNRTLDEVLDEARAACAVRHDYVVRVIDVVGDDPPFIVMELVGELGHDGYQIGSSAFVERPRSLHEAVRWVREAAAGVHAAHQRFVVHRDLKPRNVLITPVSRRAMVADFGLGIVRKRRDAASGNRCVVGTTTHMAPEQAFGMPAGLDMRGSAEDRRGLVAIDVFGLGALAFDLLTGNPPYALDNQRDAHERALSCDRQPLLGARTAWKRRMPRRLARVVEKAMTADPAVRYPTAQDFEADLIAWADNLPTSIDGNSRLIRMWLWIWRDPARSMAIFFLAVIVLAILALRHEVHRSAEQLEEIQDRKADVERELDRLRGERTALRREIARSEEERAAAAQERDLAFHKRDAANQEWRDAEERAKRVAHKLETERAARVAAEQTADVWQDHTAAAVATMQRALRDARASQAALDDTRRQLEDTQRQLKDVKARLQRLEAAQSSQSEPPPPARAERQVAPPQQQQQP